MQTDDSTSENDKKVVQRSAAYPNSTIQESVAFVTELKSSFQNRLFTRDDIAAVLGRSNINRDVAAAVQYGLLEKTVGEGYKISQTAQYIINPVTDEEREDNILECFKKPKLYIDLIERFRDQVLPPNDRFKAVLIRFHNITEAAAGQAAEVFIENAQYAGLLNKQRFLSDNKSTVDLLKIDSPVEDQQPDSVTNATQSSVAPETIIPPITSTGTEIKGQLLLEEMNGKIENTIRLTDKKIARLIYPETINEKDIKILRLQLDQILLTLNVDPD